jgi:DNA-directed RNA polymerase specialized sigma24 family protein
MMAISLSKKSSVRESAKDYLFIPLMRFLENQTKKDKGKNIDDALRHMHLNYGGEAYSAQTIALFIGIKTSKVESIESRAMKKVRRLIKEQYIHEYDEH